RKRDVDEPTRARHPRVDRSPVHAGRPAGPGGTPERTRADARGPGGGGQRAQPQDGGRSVPDGRPDPALPRTVEGADMTRTDVLNLTIREAAAHIEPSALSPVDLTDAILQRIARLDKTLNAYITVCGEQARELALAAEKMIR